MAVQPISVPIVCYLANVEPKDPKDYLWKNIASRAGLPAGKTTAVWKAIGPDEIPKTNLQRIEDAGKTKTETLLEIAKLLRCEVWELLVPPSDQGGASVTAMPRRPTMEDAVQTLAAALGGLDQEDRKHTLEALSRYAADPERKAAKLDYVLECLGGARDQEGILKRNR